MHVILIKAAHWAHFQMSCLKYPIWIEDAKPENYLHSNIFNHFFAHRHVIKQKTFDMTEYALQSVAVQENLITKDEGRLAEKGGKKAIALSALKLEKHVLGKDILADELVYTSNPRTVLKLEQNHNKKFISKFL